GHYYIRAVTNRFVTNLLDEIYDNRPCFAALDVDECDPLTRTPVTVTLGGTVSGVDILLDAGGTIAGTVTFPDGLSRAMPAGTYYVRAEDPFTLDGRSGFPTGFLIPKLYDNLVCVTVRCAVTSGTPVKVVAAQATTGIDFALENGAEINGRIFGARASDTL